MNPVFLQKISYRIRKIPVFPKLITYFIRGVYSCYLPYNLKLNKDFVIGYGGLGVVIHPRVKIGIDCHVDQNVTIGGTSKKHNVPVIGNHVYIGAGAKVLGPIIIGDNVVIGANSVVISDIPSNCVAVGIPAKVVKTGIKKSDYV